MALLSLKNTNNNFFSKEQMDYIKSEGFEVGKLDCYAELKGDVCYCKSLVDTNGWIINIYITEQGIAVDHDYDCGGNSSYMLWLFEIYSFEDAYNCMVEEVRWLLAN